MSVSSQAPSDAPNESSFPVSLRLVTEEDLPKILDIEKRIYQGTGQHWTLEHFQAEITKPYSQTWVLTDDETDEVIVGYSVFWILGDETQLLNVGVDLPYRGLGHAKKQLRHWIQVALREECKKAILEVRRSNLPAVQLYQKLGFTVTQIRKGFYTNGEDAFAMSLDLTNREIRWPEIERVEGEE